MICSDFLSTSWRIQFQLISTCWWHDCFFVFALLLHPCHLLDKYLILWIYSECKLVTKERPAIKKNSCMFHKKGKLIYLHSIYSFHNVFTKLSSWMTQQALLTSWPMHLCRLDQKKPIRISFTNISLITSGNGIRGLHMFKFTKTSYILKRLGSRYEHLENNWMQG